MPKRTMPVKFDKIELADGYEGFHVGVRTNTSPRLIKQYLGYLRGKAEGEKEARKILLRIFPWWDFCDDVGKAIPYTLAGFDDISNDLVMAMLKARTRWVQEAAMPAPLGSDLSTTGSPPPTDSPTSSEGSESGQPTPSGP